MKWYLINNNFPQAHHASVEEYADIPEEECPYFDYEQQEWMTPIVKIGDTTAHWEFTE